MREGIVRIVSLQPDIVVVAEARNGEEAVAQFLEHRPDVTLMDMQLPVMSGLQAIREAHAGHPMMSDDVAAKLASRATQPALTDRELQVLELLAAGQRNKEIAATLSISEDTARTHIKSIFVKFNVHDRTAALAEAVRRGLVHID